MSLAEELLADLEDDDLPEDDMDEVKEEVVDETMTELPMDLNDMCVRSIARLKDSEQLTRVLREMTEFENRGLRTSISGPVEVDPEYQLIVEANSLLAELENEITVIHKFARDHYSSRFPELESLVPSPLEFLRTVRVLGNEPLLASRQSGAALQQFLTPATIMVVSVTASTTQGDALSDEQLAAVIEASDMAQELHDARQRILLYVESRMGLLAPNLSLVAGPTAAAQLLGAAGGLTGLCKMPSCNILVLGKRSGKQLAGFSAASSRLHEGFLAGCPLVLGLPPDLRAKGGRLVAAKCTLAARVDSFHQNADGSMGRALLEQIQGKLDKWLEPPPVKKTRALPTPLDPPAKKRGGRRYRKMRERMGMTDMRNAANRMNFGQLSEDIYQNHVGYSLGTLGKGQSSGGSRLRAPVADAKTKAKVSKALDKKLQRQHHQQQQWGGSTSVRRHVAGTASVAFTPLQGLEISTPQAAEALKPADKSNRYFGASSTFKVPSVPAPAPK